jgi:peroxiredoxin
MKRVIEMAFFLIVMVLIIACGNSETNNEATASDFAVLESESVAADESALEEDAMNVPAEAAQAVATTVAEKQMLAATGYKVGDTAEDFALTSVDGETVSLSSYENARGYIVTFTCNTCPYAQAYEDRLIELHKNYAPQGYPVIAINPNDPSMKPGDSVEEMKQRAKQKEFPFAYVFDEGQTVFPKYGATRTPHVFLLNKDRVVKYIGAIDDNAQDPSAVNVKYVENAITALEAGKDPDPASTKAVGCGIKSKKI